MALFGKKDPGDAERHEEASPGGGELRELTTQLDHLGEQLRQAGSRLSEYLVRREAQSAPPAEPASGGLEKQIAALAEKLDRLADGGDAKGLASTAGMSEQSIRPLLAPLQERLERIETRLKSLAESPSPAGASAAAAVALPPAVTPAQVLEALTRQAGSLAQGLHEVQTHLDGGFQEIARLLCPPEPVAEPQPAPRVTGDWERVIVGPSLAANANLAFQRQQLVTGVLDGDAGACSLAGQLLVFQSAPAERLPQLLKDLGEAYYRWQPKTRPATSPMEEALVVWLRQCCDLAGISNTIELVHPGERFDAARHNATSRGVEIIAVHGWIVLRDNGKVYMKATVDVR